MSAGLFSTRDASPDRNRLRPLIGSIAIAPISFIVRDLPEARGSRTSQAARWHISPRAMPPSVVLVKRDGRRARPANEVRQLVDDVYHRDLQKGLAQPPWRTAGTGTFFHFLRRRPRGGVLGHSCLRYGLCGREHHDGRECLEPANHGAC